MNFLLKAARAVARPTALQASCDGPWRSLLAARAHSTSVGSRVEVPGDAQQAQAGDKDELYKMLELEVKGHDAAVLKSYEWFVTTAARELDIKIGKCWALRKPHFDRMTLLKSVHIYKKHRVQYEIRTHYRFVQLLQLTGSTADTFLEYVERNLPEGVGLKVTRVEVQPLPAHLVPPCAPAPALAPGP
ncbi:small ribosomal subunit protein uS10m [Bacillus rossius redtenbacheri]|uniref:small ribosomal subunit protein uS10m n=1 Tax=Bacillus rossius redtenbacheri TaxID=93214 RepID=UPI002FDD5ECC